MTWSLWAEVEDRWPTRNERLAAYIPPGSSVLDLGAGAQSLRALLVDCDYTPADIGARTPDTLEFDMNAGIWPEGRWDVAVMAGVLEYADRPDRVLRQLRKVADVAFVTYAHDRSRRLHRNPGLFRNDMSESRFRIIAKSTGWRVTKVGYWQSSMRDQAIWRLR